MRTEISVEISVPPDKSSEIIGRVGSTATVDGPSKSPARSPETKRRSACPIRRPSSASSPSGSASGNGARMCLTTMGRIGTSLLRTTSVNAVSIAVCSSGVSGRVKTVSARAAPMRSRRRAANTSLVVNYRNDGEGPDSGSGHSTLGATEVEDVEAAVSYAVRRGAERFVSFGWSKGVAIALELAHRSDYAQLVVGIVLDSPVLDWEEVIKANCKRAGLPRRVGTLSSPWLTFDPLARIIGMPSGIALREFDWVQRANELTTPTLILHGANDDSVPATISEILRDRRPDLVEPESFDSGHTLSWNPHPTRWGITVTLVFEPFF